MANNGDRGNRELLVAVIHGWRYRRRGSWSKGYGRRHRSKRNGEAYAKAPFMFFRAVFVVGIIGFTIAELAALYR